MVLLRSSRSGRAFLMISFASEGRWWRKVISDHILQKHVFHSIVASKLKQGGIVPFEMRNLVIASWCFWGDCFQQEPPTHFAEFAPYFTYCGGRSSSGWWKSLLWLLPSALSGEPLLRLQSMTGTLLSVQWGGHWSVWWDFHREYSFQPENMKGGGIVCKPMEQPIGCDRLRPSL